MLLSASKPHLLWKALLPTATTGSQASQGGCWGTVEIGVVPRGIESPSPLSFRNDVSYLRGLQSLQQPWGRQNRVSEKQFAQGCGALLRGSFPGHHAASPTQRDSVSVMIINGQWPPSSRTEVRETGRNYVPQSGKRSGLGVRAQV